MINVFKKRTSLYALTTSAFFFLQGVDVSMEVMGNRLPLPNFGASLSYANAITPNPETPPSEDRSNDVLSGELQIQGKKAIGSNDGADKEPVRVYSPITSCHSTKFNGTITLGNLMNSVEIVPGAIPGAVAGAIPGAVAGAVAGRPSHIAVPNSFDAAIPGGIWGAENGAGVHSQRASGTLLPAVPGGVGVQSGRQARNARDASMGVRGLQGSKILGSDSFNDAIYGAISCSNAGNYKVQGKNIIAKDGESAVHLKGNTGESPEKTHLRLDAVSIMHVKGENGFYSFENIADITGLVQGVSNGNPQNQKKDASKALKLSDVAVLVENGSVNLINSNIKGFFTGLEAKDSGSITMKGGSIKGAHIAALTKKGGAISLDGVKVDVLGIGLWSSGNSVIVMNSGEMTIIEGGIGVISETGGTVVLDETTVRVSGIKGSNGLSEYSAGLLSSGGGISFQNGKLEGSKAFALLINNEFGMDAFNNEWSGGFDEGEDNEDNEDDDDDDAEDNSGTMRLGEKIISTFHANGSAIGQVVSVIKNSLKENSSSIGNGVSPKFTHLMISDIQNSTIKLGGESYGIYFDGESDDKSKEYRATINKDRLHAVLLKGTRLKVPEGVAIYSDSLEGSVVIKDESTLSGGLLLNAEEDSNLFVFVQDSLIKGGARIDKSSHAKLFLSHGSEWYVTKDLYSRDLRSSDNICVDSCISSMKLANSNIRFFTSLKNGNAEDVEYRTLLIGDRNKKGNGVVYTASGTSKIYFNVNLAPIGTKNSQISDRLIINGDVGGENGTIVHVNDTSGGKGNTDSDQKYSVSLIQVYGQAEQNSFKLEGSYVTLGTPYKYILRAEKTKNDPFISSLVGLGNEFWNFSLESENVVSSGGENTESSSSSGQGRLLLRSDTDDSSMDSQTEGTLLGTTAGYDKTPNISLPNNSSKGDIIEDDDEENGIYSGSLVTTLLNSFGRSDTGDDDSIISTGGISLMPLPVTVSNSITPINSATSVDLRKPSGPVGRVLLLDRSGNGGVSSQCGNAEQNSAGMSQVAYLCSDGKPYTMEGLTLKATDKSQHSMHAKKQNTVITLESVTISGVDSSDDKNSLDLTPSNPVSAVLAEEKAEIVLSKNSTIQSSVIGLEAKSGGKVKMNDGTVNAQYVAAFADSESSIQLSNTKINMTGDFVAAALASKAGEITMDSGDIAIARGVAVRSESGGSIKLDKVRITAKKQQGKLDAADDFGRAAFLLTDNGSVDFKNGNVTTDAHALWIVNGGGNEADSPRKKRASDVRSAMNHANIESSTVKVEGDGTYGIYFDGVTQKDGNKQTRGKDLATEKAIVKRSAVSTQEKTPIGVTGAISLKKTKFEVANGIAIYGNHSGGRVSLENKTTLAGDFLLKAENDSNILVSVNNSIVTGDVRVDKSSYAKLDLVNSSEWILKRSSQRNLGVLDSGCVDSCISAVSLVNSVIDFRASKTQGQYQTLHIGNGTGRVYEAQGDALIHLNARLNPHDPSDQQVTDRIVIHGDVSGKTKIHVRGDAGNVGNGQENAKIAHSVSIIQVYGQAKKDSFQLDGDYVALINSPYKYTLRAYAPEATSKQEHVQQK
ncbi:autotransporter outer membrane beta-barrel domain-containing protein, partial [Bartonella sp. AD328YNZD]